MVDEDSEESDSYKIECKASCPVRLMAHFQPC